MPFIVVLSLQCSVSLVAPGAVFFVMSAQRPWIEPDLFTCLLNNDYISDNGNRMHVLCHSDHGCIKPVRTHVTSMYVLSGSDNAAV